jgi:hypothetical protein
MENQEKQNISEPHVQLFGEEIKSEQKEHCKCCEHKHCNCSCGCHRHGGGIIFGLVVLFVGILFLLINAGVVSEEIWSRILPLWPILLILIGIKIIFVRRFK